MENSRWIKFNFRIVVFSPWYLYDAFHKTTSFSNGAKTRSLIFLILVFSQWFLFFFSFGNILIGWLSANLGIFGFLLTNLYCQLDKNEYSEENSRFLNSFSVRLIVAIGTISYQYAFAGVPYLIIKQFPGALEYLGLDISYVPWGNIQTTSAAIIFILWSIFAVFDRFKFCDYLPRENGSFWGRHLNAFDKFQVICMSFGGLVFLIAMSGSKVFFF